METLRLVGFLSSSDLGHGAVTYCFTMAYVNCPNLTAAKILSPNDLIVKY